MHTKESISRGILDMVIASLFFGAMTGFVKFVTNRLPVFEIVFIRSLIGSAMMAIVIMNEKGSFKGTNIRLLLLRGIFGFIALVMNFYAIAKLNLGVAVILNYTSPIFVAIIAVFLLKEKISRVLWVLTATCFVGLWILVGPQYSFKSLPIIIGLLSGFMAALAFITIRMAGKEESSNTIIFYFTSVATIGSAPFLPMGFIVPNFSEWMAIAAIAITSFFGQVLITRSLRFAPASIVCPFAYLAPVFAFILGAVFWKDNITTSTLVGAGLVIVSGALIYLFESKPEPISE